jgi:hypothetical protein
MTTELQVRRDTPPEVTNVKKVTRIAMLLALLAATLGTTACQDTNLYTGVDSNGGWNAPTTRSVGSGGITGYPF